MRFVRGCVVALALAAIVAAAEPPAPDAEASFAVAMLRRDGVLVPFAVNDGKRWSSPWPGPKFQLEAPLTFASIPEHWWGRAAPASTWIAWPTLKEPRAVHVTGPVVFGAHCLSNVGLQTDYKSAEPVPPVTQHHHPKDGLATTGEEHDRIGQDELRQALLEPLALLHVMVDQQHRSSFALARHFHHRLTSCERYDDPAQV